MATPIQAMAHALSQTARIGWFFGQQMLSSRLSISTMPRSEERVQVPDGLAILRELAELMARDWSNIAAGHYRLPHDIVQPPGRLLANAVAYFRELSAVNQRRQRRGNAEVFREPPPGTPKLPRYYVQNFHYQTDGYLSEHSARLYDQQVEILFAGGADAMRRQGLVYIADYLRSRRQDRVRLLDLGCGTGQFLTFVKDNWPRLQVTALDLSPAYLAEARRRLAPFSRTYFALAAAEAIPAADASQDLVTCIYVFHELPRKVRHQVAAEIARVLKPGGRLVFIDSLQEGDRTVYDSILRYFPNAYHEPYYADYIRQDLPALFEAAGLRPGAIDLAFMSKVMMVEKPVPPVTAGSR